MPTHLLLRTRFLVPRLAAAGLLASACSPSATTDREPGKGGAANEVVGPGATTAGGAGSSAAGAHTGGAGGSLSGEAGRGVAGNPGAGRGATGGDGGATGSAEAGGAASAGSAGNTCRVDGGAIKPTDLAFPEAEGFGQHATGGRNGTVYHVTNLNDAGAGSFREAVSQPNRIVVFDVGGYIELRSAVSVKSNLTIAGQSAPGGGIGFRSGEISFANSSNIVFRHVRVRTGDDTASDTDDALSLYRAQNVIIDHSSFEFAPWNNIDGVSDDWQAHPVTNITFQDSVIANPTGQQFGAHTESVASRWSWYRNIFANSHNRNPLAKVDNVFVNNVLYNCSAGYTTHTSSDFKHDIVNNYFIFGPASTGTDNTWYQIDKNQSIYYSGNLKDSNSNGTLDGASTTPYWYQGAGTILTAPWSDAARAGVVSDAPSAFRITTSSAGALPRDAVDALVISQVRTLGKGATGTGVNTVGPDGGLYTSQTQTGLGNGGYGTIEGGRPAADADDDGMPDYWERANGSNPALADAMQKSADGYALIEHYLDWLAQPRARTSAGAPVDIDLTTLASGFSDVSPTFALRALGCGSVTLGADGHTARFTPRAGFIGLSPFEFTVTAADKTSYTARVAVLVEE